MFIAPFVGKIIWALCVVGWFIIRYPYDRRSRSAPKMRRDVDAREIFSMAISTTGLGVVPAAYALGNVPQVGKVSSQSLDAGRALGKFTISAGEAVAV